MVGRSLRRGCARVFLLAGVALLVYAAYLGLTWPDVRALATHNPSSTAFIDRARAERRGKTDVAWVWVPYAQISPQLKRAVLVGEDINFFSHDGFDAAEIHKALVEAWHERELPRGASTLTQQVAKNLWLSARWDPIRKLREALLTRDLEHHLDKRRIFEIYLNVAEFAPGIFGAEAASRRFYGTAASQLSAQQGAELAAGLPRPATWHPGCTSTAYRRRVRILMGRMTKAEFLARQL